MDVELGTPAASVASSDPLPTVACSVLPAPAARRIQVVLCLAVFFASHNFFAPTPFYPQMARDLQTTVPLLGQIMTLMAPRDRIGGGRRHAARHGSGPSLSGPPRSGSS